MSDARITRAEAQRILKQAITLIREEEPIVKSNLVPVVGLRCGWLSQRDSRLSEKDGHAACHQGDLSKCESITCTLCGNDTDSNGFYACDLDGDEVPSDSFPTPDLIRCDRCGLITDSSTGITHGYIPPRPVIAPALAAKALHIIDPGASNPVAIATDIIDAIRGGGAGYTAARSNPAIRLMVYQLAHLFNVGFMYGEEYESLVNEVRAASRATQRA